MNGLYVDHVPVEYYRRKGRSKVRLFYDSIKTLQYVAEAAIYYNPLRIFIAFFLVLVAFGCVLSLANLYLHREGVLLAIIGVFVTAILTLGLGLIAVLLKQILISSEPELINPSYDAIAAAQGPKNLEQYHSAADAAASCGVIDNRQASR
jgi:hypothetical protein